MSPEKKEAQGVVSRILALKTVAVVGCSPKPDRPSHRVADYLQRQGYRIAPVNPGHKEILGQTCYPSLAAIPFPVDVVDVFRRSAEVLPVIEEAVRIKAKALWLQDGVTHPEGEAKARAAGLLVVSDDCMLRQHRGRHAADES
ncbi:MAG: CoA-binding protein [Elusimicrobia bacterium]|nr:CoA-binding protein [Elusimicrobiota bacterium]